MKAVGGKEEDRKEILPEKRVSIIHLCILKT